MSDSKLTYREIYDQMERCAKDAPGYWLWQYGSWNTLKGMVENEVIWATAARYLNDTTEFRAASDKVKRLMQTRAYFNDSADSRLSTSSTITDVLADECHVSCFSTKFDDLSQWRAYGSASVPLAIAFIRDDLEKIEVPPNVQLSVGECIYQQEALETEIGKILGPLDLAMADLDERRRKGSREIFGHRLLSGERKTAIRDAVVAIEKLAGRFKDSSFKDEGEWRIVVRGRNFEKPLSVDFSERESKIVPRLQIPLRMADKTPVRIVGVVVGPSPHPELNVESVERLFKVHEFHPRAQVTHSMSPFRRW